ncbi:MAG: hypothetical protein ACXADC_07000 [Candidatus Thorarchaeota archaeon]|jgi:hypothetical protein
MDDSTLLKFEHVRELFKGGKMTEAEELLQQCIDEYRVSSREFMETLLKEFSEQEVKDVLVRLYSWNYV